MIKAKRTKSSVIAKALGPAAEDFGEKIKPLGGEIGLLSVRAVRILLKPLSGLIWGFEKI